MDQPVTYTAFATGRRIGSGPLSAMLRQVKPHVDRLDDDAGAAIVVFNDETGQQVDFDWRGSIADVISRAAPKPTRTGPGRPKLGVVAREISLLPRHWEWLETQPNGASAAIRRLVDQARKQDGAEAESRRRVDACGRAMTVLAGNLPGFEDAYRALYAGANMRLWQEMEGWPPDVRNYLWERLT
ncbi:MAG: DUF2239 family protein [Bryobacterales bacterium]|nr:DUF2239 family protein [Bryobacterales bacterium]